MPFLSRKEKTLFIDDFFNGLIFHSQLTLQVASSFFFDVEINNFLSFLSLFSMLFFSPRFNDTKRKKKANVERQKPIDIYNDRVDVCN